MSTKAERGKSISVLVEQAFPTCILVSFQHGEKTFRGVLLDESSQTSVIRATPSDVLGKANNTANLGLTTSRATTCQSDLHHLPSGRVNTRSSAMMLRDGREGGAERITPVHKVEGLVGRLTQRPRKLAPKPQPSHESSPPKGQPLKQDEIHGPSPQQSVISNGREGSTNNSIKRKRSDQTESSEPPSLKAAKTTHATDDGDILNPANKQEEKVVAMQSKWLASPMSGKSPLFPILKLKRTSGLDNSYVAVTMFSPVETKLKDVQNGTETFECAGGGTTEKSLCTSQLEDTTVHKHNTRFKVRNTGPQSCPTELKPEVKLSQTCNSTAIKKEELMPNIFAKNLTGTSIKTQLNSNTASKAKKRLQSNTKRQLNPRMVHHKMEVGDIAWGKVHGHPWWPCRVFAILNGGSELDGEHQSVKVTWYGSPTTSDISCSLLLTFREHFKQLYKKQKKGAYQLAVKQAQHDLDLTFSGTQVMPA